MDKKCTLIITEDDKDDAGFLQQALVEKSFAGRIEHLTNGLQLLDKLSALKQNRSLPEMIVLDLNMPYKSGLDVLKEIKTDPDYAKIPITVVTASLRREDESFCGKLGCQLFIKKPVRYSDYSQIAGRILTLMRENFTYC